MGTARRALRAFRMYCGTTNDSRPVRKEPNRGGAGGRSYCWFTVKVWPPIAIVPERGAPEPFACTVN